MRVRLHNLSARPPALSDLQAVAELQAACERADVGVTLVTEEEIENSWHAPNFVLRNDAWVIVTKKGQIVGYAEVRRSGKHQLTSLLRVHPDYLGRGIGTLLVWLTEERARSMMHAMPSDQPVSLINIVSNLNPRAQELIQREGYTLTQHYWSLLIRPEDGEPNLPLHHETQDLAPLVLDVQENAVHAQARTGIYTMHQYQIFEKVLRCASLPVLPLPLAVEVECVKAYA